jgi:hypothetical protein
MDFIFPILECPCGRCNTTKNDSTKEKKPVTRQQIQKPLPLIISRKSKLTQPKVEGDLFCPSKAKEPHKRSADYCESTANMTTDGELVKHFVKLLSRYEEPQQTHSVPKPKVSTNQRVKKV